MRRNWWKIAFFGLLIIFELTREIAVVASNQDARFAVMPSIIDFEHGGERQIMARGTLVPNNLKNEEPIRSINILCSSLMRRCFEAVTWSEDGDVGSPELNIYENPIFTINGVSYRDNSSALCRNVIANIDTSTEILTFILERNKNMKECSYADAWTEFGFSVKDRSNVFNYQRERFRATVRKSFAPILWAVFYVTK